MNRSDLEQILSSSETISQLDLGGLDLQDIDFRGKTLIDVNFRGANLKGSNWGATTITDCNLEGCNLEGSGLRAVDFNKTNLKNTIITYSYVEGRFTECDLKNADFRCSWLGLSTFSECQVAGINLAWVTAWGDQIKTYMSPYRVVLTEKTFWVGCFKGDKKDLRNGKITVDQVVEAQNYEKDEDTDYGLWIHNSWEFVKEVILNSNQTWSLSK